MASRPLTVVDAAMIAADAGLKVFPLSPMSKQPPKGLAWKEWATTDPETILAYWATHPNAGYGIACGSESDLVVIDLDTEGAIAWWRDQGIPGGLVVKTPRGGMHLYFRTAGDVEVQTNQSKLAPGVDIRAEGGYVVGPQSVLPNGSYRGDLRETIPMAPPELIALLPERHTYSTERPDVPQVEESSETERRALAWCARRLDELERPWRDGAGWRTTTFTVSCWLWRMVNSPLYALTEETALQLVLDHAPEDEKWGTQEALAEFHDAKRRTEGQYADAPDDEIPGLLPIFKAQEGAPEYTSSGQSFLDLITTAPAADTDGSRWDRRRQILQESFRAGLDMQHALSLAAGSVAAEDLIREDGGRLTLFKEAKKAKKEVERQAAEPSRAVELKPVSTTAQAERVTLLTAAERDFLGSPEARWWGTRYIEWVSQTLRTWNPPYHRMWMWVTLSVVFGLSAYIPREGKMLGVNLWGVLVGDSGTGKSESLDKAMTITKAYFPADDSPNLGNDATTEALHDNLIKRDGKVSMQVIDEAHGLLADLAGPKGFRGDLITRWTEFYEGYVSASLRSSKKEVSGKSARTSFSLVLQGTFDKMRKALNSSHWESGFLPRALFVVGDNDEISEDDLDVRLIEGDADKVYFGMPRQWAAEFKDIRRQLERHGNLPLKLDFDPDALHRLNLAMREMRARLRREVNQDAIGPYARRFPNQALKLAGLVALSEARIVVSERDVLIALEACEEFLGAAVLMAAATTSSEHGLQVDELERFIRRSGRKADRAAVYRFFDEPAREVDIWIDQLVRERRIRNQTETGELVLVEEMKEAA